MNSLSFLDWFSIAGTVVGIAGLIISLMTLKKAGQIEIAVQNSKKKTCLNKNKKNMKQIICSNIGVLTKDKILDDFAKQELFEIACELKTYSSIFNKDDNTTIDTLYSLLDQTTDKININELVNCITQVKTILKKDW